MRLMQGLADQKTEYYKDPLTPAKQFIESGAQWVHVVDLDGAFTGASQNMDKIEGIARLGIKVQVGGGIRTEADIERVLSAGASRFVVGTRACESKAFVQTIARRWPEQACVGIDARDGMAATHGWVNVSKIKATDLARSVAEAGIRTIIYTDISTDGMMTGPNFEGHKQMWQASEGTGVRFIASGGVHDRHDVVHYKALENRFPQLDGVIVGKALYEGAVELPDLLEVARG